MSASVVAAQIARLEKIGKSRALTEGESGQLQKLIAMERRYASMKQANERAKLAGRQARVVLVDEVDAG